MSTSLTTETEIREWAALRRLPDAHLERWLALEEPDRAALLEAARRLRLRTGQFVTALELLEEIAVRDPKQGNVAIVLAQDSIRQTFDGAGSVPERAHAFVEELRAMRFPKLRDTMKRLRDEVAALHLPSGINVVLPHDLASDELRIEITARGEAELEKLIDAIGRNGDGLKRIAQMLGGEK